MIPGQVHSYPLWFMIPDQINLHLAMLYASWLQGLVFYYGLCFLNKYIWSMIPGHIPCYLGVIYEPLSFPLVFGFDL